MLEIRNDGPAIVATNYWTIPAEAAGKFLVSINAGAFRLLVPRAHVGFLPDMASAAGCAVTRDGAALDILFDDGSKNPFVLGLTVASFDRLPLASDAGRTFVLTVWDVDDESGRPLKVLERPCRYRLAPLPCLKPWDA